jgi:hypothetical protein
MIWNKGSERAQTTIPSGIIQDALLMESRGHNDSLVTDRRSITSTL